MKTNAKYIKVKLKSQVESFLHFFLQKVFEGEICPLKKLKGKNLCKKYSN